MRLSKLLSTGCTDSADSLKPSQQRLTLVSRVSAGMLAKAIAIARQASRSSCKSAKWLSLVSCSLANSASGVSFSTPSQNHSVQPASIAPIKTVIGCLSAKVLFLIGGAHA